MSKPVRVRFAPSPTGLMHLGSVRTALFNYLFAKQKKGAFVLRVEDTDPERNFDPGAEKIREDLAWLMLGYNEGPGISGPYAPYMQSERTEIYQKHLDELCEKNLVYRCFCTEEELEKKRTRQIALKQPPRYDKTCSTLSTEEVEKNLAADKPFIWRFKVDQSKDITITDLVRGEIVFNLQHFSDFPLTRKNGSFTFIFANAVDDITMNISHLWRGEDHLSNTANQAQLFHAFDAELPLFWHMPIICNSEGKKLSKRDFGFSLQDLRKEGYLPEAINNYLAIIGSSFKEEIMNLDALANSIDFSSLHAGGTIKYDVEKLRWVNDQWISKYTPEELMGAALPFLSAVYPHAAEVDKTIMLNLITIIQPELETLAQVSEKLKFYFEIPSVTKDIFFAHVSENGARAALNVIKQQLDVIDSPDTFFSAVKQNGKDASVPTKELFTSIRLSLTGSPHGPSIKDLLRALGPDESKRRIEKAIKAINV